MVEKAVAQEPEDTDSGSEPPPSLPSGGSPILHLKDDSNLQVCCDLMPSRLWHARGISYSLTGFRCVWLFAHRAQARPHGAGHCGGGKLHRRQGIAWFVSVQDTPSPWRSLDVREPRGREGGAGPFASELRIMMTQ